MMEEIKNEKGISKITRIRLVLIVALGIIGALIIFFNLNNLFDWFKILPAIKEHL